MCSSQGGSQKWTCVIRKPEAFGSNEPPERHNWTHDAVSRTEVWTLCVSRTVDSFTLLLRLTMDVSERPGSLRWRLNVAFYDPSQNISVRPAMNTRLLLMRLFGFYSDILFITSYQIMSKHVLFHGVETTSLGHGPHLNGSTHTFSPGERQSYWIPSQMTRLWPNLSNIFRLHKLKLSSRKRYI